MSLLSIEEFQCSNGDVQNRYFFDGSLGQMFRRKLNPGRIILVPGFSAKPPCSIKVLYLSVLRSSLTQSSQVAIFFLPVMIEPMLLAEAAGKEIQRAGYEFSDQASLTFGSLLSPVYSCTR